MSKKFQSARASTGEQIIESFDGRLRDECLNVEWFSSLDDARQKLARFRTHYNRQRSHKANCFLQGENVWSLISPHAWISAATSVPMFGCFTIATACLTENRLCVERNGCFVRFCR